jgi:pimeloyl-ACP methyl ester carboxylesterase
MATQYLDGGVVSESGFSDASAVLDLVRRRPPLLDVQCVVYWIFVVGFALKMRAARMPGLTIPRYLQDIASKYYGLAPEELFESDSVLHRVAQVRVPALHIHAEDDWVVPVEQAIRLREATREQAHRLLGVCVKPRGAHCAFQRVEPVWRDRTLRAFFGGVAGVQFKPLVA